MKQVLIGTEGQQPFKITCSGVSRNHAKVTIDDDGVWRLQDLSSTNGTYIRDENGEMRRIEDVQIDEMTFISLGPDNVNGCSFYAKRLFASGGYTYTDEFIYIKDVEEKYEVQEQRVESVATYVRVAVGVVSTIALIGSFFVKGNLQIGLLRIGSFLSMLTSFFYNPNAKKKEIAKERSKFFHCPNPECSHILTASEIRNMQCSKCKVK